MLVHIKTVTTIRNYLKELKARGYIEIIRQGYMRPNKYILYGIAKKDWEAMVKMASINMRIQSDPDLRKRLMPRVKLEKKEIIELESTAIA